jgi:hypothetical protein
MFKFIIQKTSECCGSGLSTVFTKWLRKFELLLNNGRSELIFLIFVSYSSWEAEKVILVIRFPGVWCKWYKANLKWADYCFWKAFTGMQQWFKGQTKPRKSSFLFSSSKDMSAFCFTTSVHNNTSWKLAIFKLKTPTKSTLNYDLKEEGPDSWTFVPLSWCWVMYGLLLCKWLQWGSQTKSTHNNFQIQNSIHSSSMVIISSWKV